MSLLTELVMTSFTVVIPGIYFVSMVESTGGLKAYRYRFLERDGAVEPLNNAGTVGLVGYMLFLFSVPAFSFFLETAFGLTLRGAVEAMAVPAQILLLIMLTAANMTLAYMGLNK